MGGPHRKMEWVNGRAYAVLDTLSRKNGTRLKVGHRGRAYALLILPAGPATRDHVRAFERLVEGNGNYPRVLDREDRGGEVRLLTSWVEGHTLHWYLARGRDRPREWPGLGRTVTLVRGLAHALFLTHHRASLVHTDIKPANLVLARGPDRLVLIDFGSALTAERATRRAHTSGATAEYAAPEVWAATPDFRADIFSASVIAYEMLTGKLPFEGLGGKIAHPDYAAADPPRPEPPSRSLKHPSPLPKSALRVLDAAVTGGLALDRDRRFPAPGDFREAWSKVADALRDAERPGWLHRLVGRFRRPG